LVTETGDAAGTFTVRLIRGNAPPAPATFAEEVQVTVVVPVQLQFDPV
jgi:hypothetical protein